jgi:hypothetical protein
VRRISLFHFSKKILATQQPCLHLHLAINVIINYYSLIVIFRKVFSYPYIFLIFSFYPLFILFFTNFFQPFIFYDFFNLYKVFRYQQNIFWPQMQTGILLKVFRYHSQIYSGTLFTNWNRRVENWVNTF